MTTMDLFDKDTSQNLYSTPKYVEIRPLHALNDKGPFQFEFWSPREMFLLSTLRFTVVIKVVNDDGSVDGVAYDATADGKISLVNSPAQSLFDNIQQEIEGVPFSDHSRYYGCKAYTLQTFSYSSGVKRTNLNCELFKEDDATDTVKVNPNCSGFKARAAMIKRSKPIQLSFVPYLDFSANQHFLAPGHRLNLTLERARDEWSLLCSDGNMTPKIKIMALYAQIRVVSPIPTLSATIEKKMQSASVEYSITRNVVRTFTNPAGCSFVNAHNIYRGNLPRAIYCYFLNNEQAQGTMNTNPYVFLPYGVREGEPM
jgi:hypothetical protein